MQYPNITQYKQAIQDVDSFDTLRDGIQPVINGYDPIFASGNFAAVFKMKKGLRYYALKCFLKENEKRNYRQKRVVDYILKNPSKYFVEYHYLKNELWVDFNGGREYSVTWMKWVNAPTLGEKINSYCNTNNIKGLEKLSNDFYDFAIWILDQPFAHGDLKHDNLLVKPDGSIVMVDYDGMFLPEFKGETNSEMGGKSYQHPKRNAKTFDNFIDDFSLLVISLSLTALSKKPELYKKYNNGQNIIFDYLDFKSPNRSKLIKDLLEFPELKDSVEVLKKSLLKSNIRIAGLKEILENNQNEGLFGENGGDNILQRRIFRLQKKVVELEITKSKLLESIVGREEILKIKEKEIVKRISGVTEDEKNILSKRRELNNDQKKLERSLRELQNKKMKINAQEQSSIREEQRLRKKENDLNSGVEKLRISNQDNYLNRIKLNKTELELNERSKNLYNREELVQNKLKRASFSNRIFYLLALIIFIAGTFKAIEYSNSKNNDLKKADVLPIEIKPSEDEILKDKANIIFVKSLKQFSNGDINGAISNITDAMELLNNNAEYFTQRGNYYSAIFHFDKALTDYNRAIFIDDNNANNYYGKGNCFYERDQFREAIENYSRAISMDANRASFYNSRGECYLYLGENLKAVNDFEKAILLDPKNDDYSDNLSEIRSKLIVSSKESIDEDYIFKTTFDSSLSEVSISKGPYFDSDIVYRCPTDSTVYVLDDSGDVYYKVSVDGYVGYLQRVFLNL